MVENSTNKSAKPTIDKTAVWSLVRGLLVYFSFCAASWYESRSTCAYFGQYYNNMSWVSNDAFAFFFGGIIPMIIYKLISSSAFRLLQYKFPANNYHKLIVGLDVTFIAANVLCFALKFTYFAMPLAAPIIDCFLDLIICAVAIVIYFYYVFKKSLITKEHFAPLVNTVSMRFLSVYGLIAAINLILFLV